MAIASNNKQPAEAQPSDPRAEYLRRLEALKTTQARYERQHRRLGISKLVLGGVTLIVIGLALAAKVISVFWVAAPLAAIVVLAVIHERVLKRRERCSRTVAYYERALARLENRWMGTGETGERFENASHPYSRDLDLFGAGSLFELLCTARTQAGQETLANWLLAPASPEVVRGRHAAIEELRHRLDLREDLAVVAEDARSLEPSGSLAAWGEGAPLLASGPLRASGRWPRGTVARESCRLDGLGVGVSGANRKRDQRLLQPRLSPARGKRRARRPERCPRSGIARRRAGSTGSRAVRGAAARRAAPGARF